MINIFDTGNTYDLLWGSKIDFSITALIDNALGNHLPSLGVIWLIERYCPNTAPWAANWTTLVYDFLKPLTRTHLLTNGEVNGSAYGFEPEYKADLPGNLTLAKFPDQVVLKVHKGQSVSITWLERSHQWDTSPNRQDVLEHEIDYALISSKKIVNAQGGEQVITIKIDNLICGTMAIDGNYQFLGNPDDINKIFKAGLPYTSFANWQSAETFGQEIQIKFPKQKKAITVEWLEKGTSIKSARYCDKVGNLITCWHREERIYTAPKEEDLEVKLDSSFWLINSCVITGDGSLTGISNDQKGLIMYQSLKQTLDNITDQLNISACKVLIRFDATISNTFGVSYNNPYWESLEAFFGIAVALYKVPYSEVTYSNPFFSEVPDFYHYAYMECNGAKSGYSELINANGNFSIYIKGILEDSLKNYYIDHPENCIYKENGLTVNSGTILEANFDAKTSGIIASKIEPRHQTSALPCEEHNHFKLNLIRYETPMAVDSVSQLNYYDFFSNPVNFEVYVYVKASNTTYIHCREKANNILIDDENWINDAGDYGYWKKENIDFYPQLSDYDYKTSVWDATLPLIGDGIYINTGLMSLSGISHQPIANSIGSQHTTPFLSTAKQKYAIGANKFVNYISITPDVEPNLFISGKSVAVFFNVIEEKDLSLTLVDYNYEYYGLLDIYYNTSGRVKLSSSISSFRIDNYRDDLAIPPVISVNPINETKSVIQDRTVNYDDHTAENLSNAAYNQGNLDLLDEWWGQNYPATVGLEPLTLTETVTVERGLRTEARQTGNLSSVYDEILGRDVYATLTNNLVTKLQEPFDSKPNANNNINFDILIKGNVLNFNYTRPYFDPDTDNGDIMPDSKRVQDIDFRLKHLCDWMGMAQQPDGSIKTYPDPYHHDDLSKLQGYQFAAFSKPENEANPAAIYEVITNRVTTDVHGNKEIKQGGFVKYFTFFQGLEQFFFDIAKGLGLQESGGIQVPKGDGSGVEIFESQLEINLEQLFLLSKMSKVLNGIDVNTNKGMVMQESLLSGLGVPITQQLIPWEIGDRTCYINASVVHPNSPSIMSTLMGLKVNTGFLVASNIGLKEVN
jgi:hypothetical protein